MSYAHDCVLECRDGRQHSIISALLALTAFQTPRLLPKASLQHSADIRHSMQVMKALQQQQMLQAAGGIAGLVALLQTSPGDTSTQQTTTIV